MEGASLGPRTRPSRSVERNVALSSPCFDQRPAHRHLQMVSEAQTGIAAPFERTTFVFEMPRVEVARVPALVASAGVTASFAIP